MGRSRRLRSTAEGIGAPKRENKLENLMFKGRDMNVMVRKGDRRSGGRVGLAAEAGPVSRSFDLLTFEVGQLSLTLLADPQGVRRRIDHASVDTCAALFWH